MDIILLYLFIAGLFFGSFFNVVAERMCKNESIISPGSHCTNCKHRLSWYELIPVFSYLFLKGKCKKCKIKLSVQYPLTELITGLLFAGSYLKFGFSYETIISIVIVSVIIITFITDVKYMIILDEVVIVGSILIIVLLGVFYSYTNALRAIVGGLFLFGLLFIIKFLGDRVFKQESLGWGDIKLSFFVGLILGIRYGVIYIFLSAFLALPYAIIVNIRKKENIIPFGPFLVISFLLIYWNMGIVEKFLNFLLGV